jgi:hypothetical protein
MKFRRTIAAAGVALALGLLSLMPAASAATLTGEVTADNAFFAFLATSPNSLGTLIGSGNGWPTSFALTPTGLTPNVTYYLNIEAINYGGPGGLDALLNLTGTGFKFANGTQTLTTNAADVGAWKASYNDTNSDPNAVQPWVPATGQVIVDTGYAWGNITGSAGWIDASSGGLNLCGYCTVDFTVAITPTTQTPEPATWTMMVAGLLSFAGVGVYRRRKLAEAHLAA